MNRVRIYNSLLTQLQSLRDAPYNLEIPIVELGLDNASNQPLQPAVYLAPAIENSEYKKGLPIKWIVKPDIYVFVKKSGDSLGVQNLLPILDALDLVLSPQVNQRGPGSYANDLGLPGIVSHCAISGSIEIFGGYLDEQTIARIPIEIVTAG